MSDKCPKCGSTLIYVGVAKIECGENFDCENWSKKQAFEVQNIKKQNQSSDLSKVYTPCIDPFDTNLDLDDDTVPLFYK